MFGQFERSDAVEIFHYAASVLACPSQAFYWSPAPSSNPQCLLVHHAAVMVDGNVDMSVTISIQCA